MARCVPLETRAFLLLKRSALQVYDISKFADAHPGGKKIILRYAGKDATNEFNRYHSPQVLSQFGSKLQVGVVDSVLAAVAKAEKMSAVDEKKKYPLRTGQLEVYGDLAPFA